MYSDIVDRSIDFGMWRKLTNTMKKEKRTRKRGEAAEQEIKTILNLATKIKNETLKKRATAINKIIAHVFVIVNTYICTY